MLLTDRQTDRQINRDKYITSGAVIKIYQTRQRAAVVCCLWVLADVLERRETAAVASWNSTSYLLDWSFMPRQRRSSWIRRLGYRVHSSSSSIFMWNDCHLKAQTVQWWLIEPIIKHVSCIDSVPLLCEWLVLYSCIPMRRHISTVLYSNEMSVESVCITVQ